MTEVNASVAIEPLLSEVQDEYTSKIRLRTIAFAALLTLQTIFEAEASKVEAPSVLHSSD